METSPCGSRGRRRFAAKDSLLHQLENRVPVLRDDLCPRELPHHREIRFRGNTGALKELEEWFDSQQKEIRGIAKLDPFFERTSKLAARRIKREMERRGTLGEFALEADRPHLKTIPNEESGSDLFRSDGPDAVGGAGKAESPQSVVQGCPAQGGAVGPGEKES